MSEESPVKIHVDLPRSKGFGGESFWAEDLGNDLYRVRNIPFSAFGINFNDVVLAKPQSEELVPSIIEVHEHSGHKTLRVIFQDDASEEERCIRLARLNQFNAFHENANGTLFAIDVEPEGDYAAVCDILFEWENAGILCYETCEAREGLGFDGE